MVCKGRGSRLPLLLQSIQYTPMMPVVLAEMPTSELYDNTLKMLSRDELHENKQEQSNELYRMLGIRRCLVSPSLTSILNDLPLRPSLISFLPLLSLIITLLRHGSQAQIRS